MINNLNNLKLGFLLVAILSLVSCEKMIAIDPPLNETSTATVYSSDKLAASALSGMYGTLSQSETQSLNFTLYSSLQADDLLYLYTATSLVEMNNNSYSVLSTTQAGVFSDWYSVIYKANAIIDGLQTYSGTSDSIKKEYTAEAKFVRAYCYFNLVNTFGSIPLVLTTDVTVSAYLPKSNVDSVYNQITKDLLDARDNLKNDYSFTSGSRVGVNKYVADALLARIYLFRKDYSNAEFYANEVITSGLYSLTSSANINNTFVNTSTESIWLLSSYLSATTQYTAEGVAFNPFSISLTYLYYQLRPSFVQLYSSNDLRRVNWMKDLTFGGNTYTIPFKYKYRDNASAIAAGVTELPVIMRLSEQYLIRAEARAQLGSNLDGALSDLNMVHSRAGLSTFSSLNQKNLIDTIALENRKEFFCEQAFRWFNLKRTATADAILGSLKSTYTSRSQLLPIPQAAIDANPQLTQNPGY
ncbi:RagB/SusD family nutrient uptake outer membrane protein [Rhizosphaericola mali]|uniref:RagB/SusD family nutrient uptake outer membrane protein n=1 Tax=Rhizosphaericola mali TaxID=2545455 RepID=A0A5P2G420_9BACT|nr:RagB/SusD family nutrient uptake outer membrane protein [Rhizosphaericola mali]QES88572.1 RagB/SusD family nutrient uptake outer membrane protein [Rhizosphaericola mali]